MKALSERVSILWGSIPYHLSQAALELINTYGPRFNISPYRAALFSVQMRTKATIQLFRCLSWSYLVCQRQISRSIYILCDQLCCINKVPETPKLVIYEGFHVIFNDSALSPPIPLQMVIFYSGLNLLQKSVQNTFIK